MLFVYIKQRTIGILDELASSARLGEIELSFDRVAARPEVGIGLDWDGF
jgi:hypothetical protein